MVHQANYLIYQLEKEILYNYSCILNKINYQFLNKVK